MSKQIPVTVVTPTETRTSYMPETVLSNVTPSVTTLVRATSSNTSAKTTVQSVVKPNGTADQKAVITTA